MIFRLFIDRNQPEEVTATVHERTPLIDEIERMVLQADAADALPGYRDDEIVMLELNGIECLLTESGRTYAVYRDGKRYQLRRRLCELEPALPGCFERISKSAIANWKAVARFRVQLSGAVDAVFKSGYSECISRRCFQDLKRRYGL